MSSALDKLRSRSRQSQPATVGIEIGSHRGVVTTMSAQIADGVEEDDASAGPDQLLKPGRILSGTAASSNQAQPSLGGASDVAELADSTPHPLSAIEKLRKRAQQEQATEADIAGFRKNMAALRTLGRLMEAVYIRPGNASPVQARMKALVMLAQASQSLSQNLLDAIGEKASDRAYVRAMAMDAVAGVIGQAWEDAEDDAAFLSLRPVDLIQEAAAHPVVVEASLAMAQKTWNPVTSQAQHDEALVMAAHKAYWSLYMQGEYVVGMNASICELAVTRLMSHLQDYPQPRGSSPEMRASWLTASMGRLSRLIAAEVRARFAVSDDKVQNAIPVTSEVINECVDLAIEGFENVERHAQKILGIGCAERSVAADGVADGERTASGR